MSIVHPSLPEVFYPSSDGLPVGETPLHFRWIVYIDNVLERRYRGQRVYRGANMCVYYVPGDPTKFIVPDNFIAFDCDPGEVGDRDVYKTWEDPPPSVVFEVSSKSTAFKDREVKPETYARVGVREIILYDPRGEMQPALQGLRVINGNVVRIKPDSSSSIESEELGLLLSLSGNSLVIADRDSGEILHTDCEAYSAELAKRTAEAAANAAEAAANAARASASDRRAAAVEEENRRLRELLKARGIDPNA